MSRFGTTEERHEVRPIRVTLRCECGGQMVPTGLMLASNPPQYPHRCSLECGIAVNVLGKQYPYIDYEAIDA